MIEEYLDRHFDRAMLLARPRRFGKTLTMTMFRDFLDIRQDSREIFEGLKIMNYPETVERYMNRYPVVFISLKEIFGNSFAEVLDNLRIAVSNLFEEHAYLLKSPGVSDAGRALFTSLWYQQANQANTEQALNLLCRMLRQHYGKQVFVIIDEYDVPMAKAAGTPDYEKIRDMVEHMLSYICKTNEDVRAVLLSGCLYTVKNSAYTGVNNITAYTVLSQVYAPYVGFTDGDVRKLLDDAEISSSYDLVAEWYDGYLFGKERMYCPWDVLMFVRSVLDGSYSRAMGPKSYWVNTSETSLRLIRGFLGKTSDANEKFERLLAGYTIDYTVNDHLAYHRIHESGDNLWSALLETGYLTKAVEEEMPRMPLRIPNREIQDVFREEVWAYFQDKIDNAFVRNLVNALWGEEVQSAQDALNQVPEAALSFYHEYHEYSYHLILDGFFTGFGYQVLSEMETGYGRSDLIIPDPARSRCMILELKHVKTQKEMKTAVCEASSQIIRKECESPSDEELSHPLLVLRANSTDSRETAFVDFSRGCCKKRSMGYKYESRLIYEGYRKRLKYGIAFFEKSGLIAEVKDTGRQVPER